MEKLLPMEGIFEKLEKKGFSLAWKSVSTSLNKDLLKTYSEKKL